jgi:hypothetical protein
MGGVDVKIHVLLTYALVVSGKLHISAALPSGKEPPVATGWGGWVGPRAGLDETEK